MKKQLLATAVLAAVAAMLCLSTVVPAVAQSLGKASAGTSSANQPPAAPKMISSRSFSFPLFFEPNQGQTDPQVKFLSRGSGYGLFLTSDEAVLKLHRPVNLQHGVDASAVSDSVIRMRLDGANSSASVSGMSPLRGKSNYFVGNDSSKWRQNIPQFARVQYQAVYPGVNLVYYGNQGQLEYDFRVAPNADPSKIALSFEGASTRIEAGDLVLSTPDGDIRFHAPRVYQPATAQVAQSPAVTEKNVAGSFRQLANNRIGFTIGDYDHSRELVIDPILTYSTFIGGSGSEGAVSVAVDSAGLIYLAGSTTSPDFPSSAQYYPNNLAFQPNLAGTQNIFIAVINSTLVPPTYIDAQQLVYATYLGGNGVDTPAGIAVDGAFSIYVAGTTSSTNFPFTQNAFQQTATFSPTQTTHGFLSKVAFNVSGGASQTYALSYSTYLAGNGTDRVTGLAIDATKQNAYVTGDTTSSDAASNGFPANPNGFQTASNSPGNPQFFASQINTGGSGFFSMLYSTYFGGGYPVGATANGGGIAVDPISTNVNMYITGTTNMLPVTGPNGEAKFPLYNAQQSCLNSASATSNCNNTPTSITDAFVAKLNPNTPALAPLYSTYLGGSGTDAGLAIAVDGSANAYIGGSTNSTDWVCRNSCPGGFDGTYNGSNGNSNGFVAKIGSEVNSQFPLSYFTYIGGTGPDSVNAIQVDSLASVHIAGNVGANLVGAPGNPGGGGDAFVGVISTTSSGVATGDYVLYLGGSQLDQGTGVALDSFNATYVAGNTVSPNFPVSSNPYQATLNNNSQDAFVSKVGSVSQVVVSNSSASPSPNPVAAGTQVAFTFLITNEGPDNASQVNFYATMPSPSILLGATPTARVTAGTGTCSPLSGTTIPCFFPTLTVCTLGVNCSSASVEVDVTPSITDYSPTIQVSGVVNANGGPIGLPSSQQVQVVDFKVIAASPNPNPINAGDSTTIQVQFCPLPVQNGSPGTYSGTITPSDTITPSMVTASTPTFNPTTISLSGSACGTTTMSIATVARPVNTGSLFHRAPFYATWLPIGGLSLLGFGFGVGKSRRRWLTGMALCAIFGTIMLQLACGSSSSSVSPTGGTVAQTYNILITGSAATGASHNQNVQLVVH